MNQAPPPQPPPFNDSLYKALNPLKQIVDNQQRLDLIRKKYGFEKPIAKPGQPHQWVGDNRG